MNDSQLVRNAIHIILPPVILMLLIAGLNYLYLNYFFLHHDIEDLNKIDRTVNFIYWVGIGCSSYWLLLRLINYAENQLINGAFLINHPTTRIIFPFLSAMVKTIAFLIIFNWITPYLGLPSELAIVFEKVSSILIICAIAWLFFKLTHISEQLILHYYRIKTAGDVNARKMYTQMLILKRIAIGVITILTAGAILMLFDNVRALGASVLTTAGVIGLVLTFTAQRSLASIFSSLEIALTQPIKIGDMVVIEGEFGAIEEINFRNVIIKLWDWRRLVVPTSYFLEKPFQNWSREQSNNLIGTVYLYADYTLPVDELRKELTTLLKSTPLWDGKVSSIQVSDLKQQVMELRILASAKSPSEAWDLRCEVREKLIAFIAKNYPMSLPMDRYKQFD